MWQCYLEVSQTFIYHWRKSGGIMSLIEIWLPVVIVWHWGINGLLAFAFISSVIIAVTLLVVPGVLVVYYSLKKDDVRNGKQDI